MGRRWVVVHINDMVGMGNVVNQCDKMPPTHFKSMWVRGHGEWGDRVSWGIVAMEIIGA